MSEASLLARLHDRPGALERAIGLIRRRAHGIHRISVAEGSDAPGVETYAGHGESLEEPPPAAGGRAVIELVLRVDEARTPRERVRRDLLALEDLVDIRDLEGDAPPTRELLLAWIRSDAAPQATGSGRIVAVSGANSLLEMTGTPAEIDALLARLDKIEAVIATVRSGEVAAPMPITRHVTGVDEVRDDLSANNPNNSSQAALSLSVDELSTDSAREPSNS